MIFMDKFQKLFIVTALKRNKSRYNLIILSSLHLFLNILTKHLIQIHSISLNFIKLFQFFLPNLNWFTKSIIFLSLLNPSDKSLSVLIIFLVQMSQLLGLEILLI